MEEKAIESTLEDDDNKCNANSNSSNIIQWSSETNWVIAHGSIENSINIESSDYLITESEAEDRTRNPPLVFKPHGPDSPPCEIKICFTQKYDIGQIYVRSSARTFEVYYAKSPQSENEYLCTVRCGIAERDEEILQTSFVEDVAKDQTEEISTDGGSIVSSDDDWVKIKVPEVDRSSLSKNTNIDKAAKLQDLYEATAQISDADPCSLLTIRLLSLQDKGHVYVDEIYIFVDPVELTDTGPEVPVGSSSQSPLLAMLVPTLLQLSRPGASRVKDKQDSIEQHKDDKMETRRIDEVDIGLGKNQVDEQYVKLKDAAKSNEIQQSDSALNSKELVEFIGVNNLPQERIERALEQLINRVSRVEDICLRFEEKMLKPIESMEARLQEVEQQLGKLTKNFNYSNLPHGTRISAPEFSYSGSNSSSFYNEGSDYVPSEIEKKDLSCNKMHESSHCANFRASLVVKAPEFSCSESNSSSFYHEGNDYISSEIEKKDLWCNKMHESSHYANIRPNLVVKAPEFSCSESNSSSFCNKGNDYIPSEIEKKDLLCNKMHESSHYANIRPSLVVKAPEFSCSVDEEYYDDLKESKDDSPCIKPKNTLSVDDALAAALSGFLSTAKISFSENIQTNSVLSIQAEEQNPHQEFAESCQIEAQELPDSESCNRGSSKYTQILAVTAPDFVEEIVEEELINSTEPPIETDCVSKNEEKDHVDEELVKCTEPTVDTDCVSKNEDKDHGDVEPVKITEASPDTSCFLKNEEKNHGNETVPPSLQTKILSTSEDSCDLNRNETSPNVSESLDFEFPILEVKFNSNSSSSSKSPLEALLDGETKSNSEAPVHDSNVEDFNETKDLLPNHLLVDLGFSSVDGSANLCSPSSQEMTVSLI